MVVFPKRSIYRLVAVGVLLITASSLIYIKNQMGQSSNPWESARNARFWDIRLLGAKGDGITDDTPIIQEAIWAAAATNGGRIYIPAGTYSITGLQLRASGVSIAGAGAAVTILRRALGSKAANVLEVGETALGNDANYYEKISVSGLTLDGNRHAVPPPKDDLTD